MPGFPFSPAMSTAYGNSLFPLLTPKMPMFLNPLKQEFDDVHVGAINQKMDSMLSHLKKEIDSHTAEQIDAAPGRTHQTFETEDSTSPPNDKHKVSSGNLNLNMDLIDESYTDSERRNRYSNTNTNTSRSLLHSKSSNSTATPKLRMEHAFSPQGYFIPKSRTNINNPLG